MKRILFLTLAAAAAANFWSCGKDDDEPGNGEVTGKWYYVSQSVDVVAADQTAQNILYDEICNECLEVGGVMFSLNGDGTGEDDEGGPITYNYSNGNLIIYDSEGLDYGYRAVNVNGNKMQLTRDFLLSEFWKDYIPEEYGGVTRAKGTYTLERH